MLRMFVAPKGEERVQWTFVAPKGGSGGQKSFCHNSIKAGSERNAICGTPQNEQEGPRKDSLQGTYNNSNNNTGGQKILWGFLE